MPQAVVGIGIEALPGDLRLVFGVGEIQPVHHADDEVAAQHRLVAARIVGTHEVLVFAGLFGGNRELPAVIVGQFLLVGRRRDRRLEIDGIAGSSFTPHAGVNARKLHVFGDLRFEFDLDRNAVQPVETGHRRLGNDDRGRQFVGLVTRNPVLGRQVVDRHGDLPYTAGPVPHDQLEQVLRLVVVLRHIERLVDGVSVGIELDQLVDSPLPVDQPHGGEFLSVGQIRLHSEFVFGTYPQIVGRCIGHRRKRRRGRVRKGHGILARHGQKHRRRHSHFQKRSYHLSGFLL